MLNRQYHPFRILLAYSLVAAALYAAQLIPYTGVFLMMLGGALWISILLNLMLVHIAIAALQRRIPRIWLALPGGIYGMWLIIFAVQSLKTSKEIASLNAANEILSPIPENVDLIFDQNDPLAIDAKKYIIGSPVFAGEFEAAVSHGTKPDGCFSLTDPAAGERSFGYFNTTPDYDSRGTCIITKVSHSPRSGLCSASIWMRIQRQSG